MEANFLLNIVEGQDEAVSYLQFYSKNPDKLPPLLILHGPDGVGKWLAADKFSQVILCENGTACGNCQSCRMFMAQQHPDYVLFPPDKPVLIGDVKDPDVYTVRWLQSTRMQYKPHLSGKRIILLPDASLIQNEAETALLKSLEEAPFHTRFIFLVNSLSRLKETIVSRAVTIPFNYLPRKTIEKIAADNNDSADLYYGGSFNPFEIPGEVEELCRAKILDAPLGRMHLLNLENWIRQYKTNHPEWTEDFNYHEFLEFTSLLLIYAYTSENYDENTEKIEEIYRFKRYLHYKLSGLENYLVSSLFNKLIMLTGH